MSSNSLFHLYIQSNSPGELSTWVRPIIKQFQTHYSYPLHITIFLTPCQYASGREADIAKSIEGVTTVYTPAETMKWLFLSSWIGQKKAWGAVIHLGGDPLYSQLLAFKLGLPAFSYTEHNRKSGPFFNKVFYQSDVGDLMAARIANYHSPTPSSIYEHYNLEEADYCTFLCGSRPQHFEAFVPFVLDAIERIKQTHPDFPALIVISPFISDELLNRYLPQMQPLNVPVIRGRSLDLMTVSRLIVTLPGSNTAEAMYLNRAILVILPLNRPDLIIVDGLLGLLGKLPLIGSFIMKRVIGYLKKRIRFTAIPNKLSQSAIVPEMVDVITSQTMAQKIESLYYSPEALGSIRDGLARFVPSTEAAETIVSYIINVCRSKR